MAKIIYQNQITDLAEELTKLGRVVAPLEKHPKSGASKVVFSDFEPGEKIELDYPTTVLPPKEFLLPPADTVLEFNEGKVTNPKTDKTFIFGVSYEDLEGLSKLKEVFEKPIKDKVFADKAKNTVIIAADRYSPPKKISFDLYLQKLTSETYAAFAGSKEGQKILKLPYFKSEKVTVPQVTKKKDMLLLDPLLPEAIERSREHPVWSELENQCFACGICSFTCPLCYCFETEDTSSLPSTTQVEGKRVRTWSTCFSEDFAKTAGHNFRPQRKDRIYNWYHHKFVRMPREYKFTGCVDCNRCVIFCPAKINYREVLERVLKDYKEKKR